MDTQYIQPHLVRNYLFAFQGISPGILDGSLGGAGKMLSDKTLQPQLRAIIRSDHIAVNTLPAIPTTWLSKVWEVWVKGINPDYILNIARRVGKMWWGYGCLLTIEYWEKVGLYHEIYPIVSRTIETFRQNKQKRSQPDDSLFYVALEAFSQFLATNLFCHIRLEKIIRDKRIVFHIKSHPFAEIDGDKFRLFWGLVEGFCESLSYPSVYFSSGKTEYIHIDEQASTTNRIVIVSPF